MILTRLGYKNNITVLSDAGEQFLQAGISKGMSLCSPKGVYRILKIVDRDNSFVRLEEGQVLKSESLAKLLEKSEYVTLMAATVGMEVVEVITKEVTSGDAALGVILDSVASQTADACLDFLMDFINKALVKESVRLTKHRYSPGYGDLPLSNQKIIFESLKLEKLDIEITERFMLIPEKSVIAIAGLEKIEGGTNND